MRLDVRRTVARDLPGSHNRKRERASTNRAAAVAWLSLAMLVVAAVWPVPALATGKGATLYELNEQAQIVLVGDVPHRMAMSGLQGKAKRGTPLCPEGLMDYAEDFFFTVFGITVEDASRCTIVVFGESDISLTTFGGTIGGDFWVVVNSDLTNLTDAPELVIMAGTFTGNIQVFDPDGVIITILPGSATLTPTFVLPGFPGGVPSPSPFTGKFRLPFKFHHDAVYKKDNGQVVKVKPDERALGDPTVRLELSFD